MESVKFKNTYIWFLVVLGLGCGLVAGWVTGHLPFLFEKDRTPISAIIIALVVVTLLRSGLEALKLDKARQDLSKSSKFDLTKYLESQEHGWFLSEIMSSLGLLGTIIGFTLLLSGFSFEDVNKHEAVLTLLKTVAGGLGTALLTTLVGIVGSMLVKSYYFTLKRSAEKIMREAESLGIKTVRVSSAPSLKGSKAGSIFSLLGGLFFFVKKLVKTKNSRSLKKNTRNKSVPSSQNRVERKTIQRKTKPKTLEQDIAIKGS